MFTWGEIRVGYYVGIVVLAWLVNGQASAVFLAILLALFFEQPFRLFVFSRVTLVEPAKTVKATANAAPVKTEPAAKKTTAAAAKKPATGSAKPKKTTAKPKPKLDDD